MKKYELIDHTADIGIKVRGKSVGELFENAAYAMFDLIADLNRVKKREVLGVEIEGEGMDELLADWLRELLYKFNGERHLLKDFKIEEIDQKSLKARVRGEKLDLSRHSLKMEIKAVTYYGLEIKRTSEGWQAQVIFDV
ncbi:archease [Candidatus Aerophobetes bacterium]|uniref:Protein archease n=1 Tax=Aerophobetes bacterium TaxID=2030807 RepID=A0A497E1Y1_UNCAE|nr:MAG: archease [Candidatus Aerophobetes bacterium]